MILHECDHLTIHNTLCKFCGILQCDICRKTHELQHIANNDQELSDEDLEGNDK